MLQILHELWDFVIGGHPCPTDTFLVSHNGCLSGHILESKNMIEMKLGL